MQISLLYVHSIWKGSHSSFYTYYEISVNWKYEIRLNFTWFNKILLTEQKLALTKELVYLYT